MGHGFHGAVLRLLNGNERPIMIQDRPRPGPTTGLDTLVQTTVETAYKVTGYKVKSLIKYINKSSNMPLKSNFSSVIK